MFSNKTQPFPANPDIRQPNATQSALPQPAIPTGMAMLLKTMGIDPQAVMDQIATAIILAHQTAASIDARLSAIEQNQVAIVEMLTDFTDQFIGLCQVVSEVKEAIRTNITQHPPEQVWDRESLDKSQTERFGGQAEFSEEPALPNTQCAKCGFERYNHAGMDHLFVESNTFKR